MQYSQRSTTAYQAPWMSALVALVVSVPAHAQPPRDSDRDGLPDELERRTGTDPLAPDTDLDGVPDGVEDESRDGRVDAGESNPRRPGLFPGSRPHIPEPLVFDLVRGLGASKGELEVNTLTLFDVESKTLVWAPEVEWAFADGYAVELELPMVDRHLEALKLALQGTLPSPWASFTHGWQGFAEVGLDAGDTDGVLLYILGQRPAPMWSYLVMLGANTTFSERSVAEIAAIANASLFADVREWQTWGIETNTSLTDGGEWVVRAFPQVHIQLSEELRIQLSAGAELRNNQVVPLAALRLVLE